MAVRSFKSVGVLKTAKKFSKESFSDPKPVSIKTPVMNSDGRTDMFDCHFFITDSIHDNLKNLVLTNAGERLGRTNFGANLRALTTELTSKDDFETEAMISISSQVEKFMPFIELDTFETDLDETGSVLKFAETDHQKGIGIIKIKIQYSVPQLGVIKRGLIANIHCIG